MGIADEARAEIVELCCEGCGLVFRIVGCEPEDREICDQCPRCHLEVAEYGQWFLRRVALIYPDRIVFASLEDAAGFKIEVKS